MRKIAHFIIHSKAATYIAALLYVAMWCSQSLQVGGITLRGVLALLLTLVTGILSVKVAREFSLCDVKNTLPATLFFLGSTIAPQVSPPPGDGAHLILFGLACYVLLRTYRHREAMGSYFFAFVLIGVQCLMIPSLLLALPLLVLCTASMESLHVRTFFAALWGLLCPYWVIAGVLFLTDRVELIAPCWSQICSSAFSVATLMNAPQLWTQLLWSLLLALPGSVAILLDRTMRIQTNASYRLLMSALVVLLISAFLSPTTTSALMPCILLGSSLIGTGLFVTHATRAKNIYLVALLLLWLTFIARYIHGTAI